MADKGTGFVADKCGMCLSILLLIIAIGAVACALAVTAGCDFVIYEPAVVPPDVPQEVPIGFENVTYANIGLFQYDPDGFGCRTITDDFDNLGWQITTARVGNALAVIVGGVALLMHLIDFLVCRFPCSRIFICMFFVIAFIAQALTFFIFATNVCDANFKNAPYPCEPDSGCWISVSATVLFFIASCLACCVPKPQPVVGRVREHLRTDETDSCWILCQKNPEEEEEDELEKGAADIEKEDEEDVDATTEEDVTEEDVVPAPEVAVPVVDEQLQALQEQEARAQIVTTLATARRGKQEEIEHQLEMLTKYKEYLPEEEYETKVAALLIAMPDPGTYDECTKTELLVDVEEEVEEEKKREQEEEEKEEEEEREEQEKERELAEGSAHASGTEEGGEEEEHKKKHHLGDAVKGTGKAIGAGFTKMAHAVTPKKHQKAEAPEATVPQDVPS